MSDAANPARDSAAGGQVLRLSRHLPRPLEILVDGLPTLGFEGETIATAILAQRRQIGSDGRRTHGLWCGIGICYECVVTLDGEPGIRACMTQVAPGSNVRTQSARGVASGIASRAEAER